MTLVHVSPYTFFFVVVYMNILFAKKYKIKFKKIMRDRIGWRTTVNFAGKCWPERT